MTGKVADSIRRGLEEALVYAEGTADATNYSVHIPQVIDVKAIRAKLHMSQEEFAARFGFSINTLRHWEQGRRVPKGPASLHGGGESGIRTHGTLSRTHAFQACALNRSAISPAGRKIGKVGAARKLERSKDFFFEKKKQKTFTHLGVHF